MKNNPLLLSLASASFLLVSACGSGGSDNQGTTPPDADGDGIADTADNCPAVANASQTDSDRDGVGDACDAPPPPVDTDGDGVADTSDNCPTVANADQADADNDGIGNVCDSSNPPVDPSFVSCNGNTCTITGVVNQNYTMQASRNWILDGVVQVGNGNATLANADAVAATKAAGVTLTIEAGTNIKSLDDGVLLVTRGSKLNAIGTATAPITISSLDDNFDGEGEWGGVIIQGFAPQFGKGNTGACFGSGTVCNVAGEGGTFVGNYGGNDPADNSGTIKYLRIAEAGLVAGPNNEVNGLTLMGVGYGTTVDYVHVHNNLDDGIEWFGGTVNVTHIVLTNNDDDDIDFDEGYKGNIQYAIVQKNQTKAQPTGSNDPRGIEANSSNADLVTETQAVLSNVSIIGGPVVNASGRTQPGVLARGAVTMSMFNSAVKGFNAGCIRIDDADTNNDSTADVRSNVSLTNVLGDCAAGLYARRAADSATNATASTITFNDAYAINESSARLSAAPSITPVANGSSFQFEPTNYVGAIAPDTSAASAWWAGWTLPGVLAPVAETPAPASFVSCASNVCTVTGTINTNYTFTAGTEWRIDGTVLVGSGNRTITDAADVAAVKAAGVTLTIRPGVNVKAFDDGVLIVTRGSKLVADGSANAPITFSSLDDNFDGEGEWGGVIVQGFAPQFGRGNTGACFGSGTVCNVAGEGGTFVGNYGGNEPADNSGVLRYVRIAEGGLVAGPNNEVNGLTLMGVGHGTLVDYVQVHNNLDDGIEWFGGTVNVRHMVLTNNDDDDIDFDEGYKGNMQFAIVRKNPTKTAPTGSNDPRAIEANSSNADLVVDTQAMLANLTLIGGPVNNVSGRTQPGVLARGAVTMSMVNSAVRGFDVGCVRIDDADTNNDTVADVRSVVSLSNVLGECTAGFYARRAADNASNAGASTVTLDTSYALTESTATLSAPSSITPVNNGSNFTFDATDYIGAVKPGTSANSAWWKNWTIPGSL